MIKGFCLRQRPGVDGTKECDLIRMDISCIKDIGQFDFIRSKFEFYRSDYPYLQFKILSERDQYLIQFHHHNEYYPLATLRDYGGNIDDDLWFGFLIHMDKYKITYGDMYGY